MPHTQYVCFASPISPKQQQAAKGATTLYIGLCWFSQHYVALLTKEEEKK